MTSRQVADIINNRELYIRKDGLFVSASQVTTRVGNYHKIFAKEYGEIKLLRDDFVSLEFQKYRNILVHSSNPSYRTGKANKMNLLINTLEDLLNDTDFRFNNDFINEPNEQYGEDLKKQRNKLKVAYRLCDWFFKQNMKTSGILSDKLVFIISRLDWFNSAHNNIKIDFNGFHHFLLKLASENVSSTFEIQLGDHLELSRRNPEMFDVNHIISNLINKSNYNYFLSSNQVNTGIFIPPFGKKGNPIVPTEFENIITEINSSCSELNKAVLLVPSSVLNNRKQSFVEAREKIIFSKALESVIAFPNGMIEHTAVNLSMLLFNFNDRNDSIFFYDASGNLSNDECQTIKAINKKEEIKDFSIQLSIEKIESTYFSLTPKKYSFNPKEIEVEVGYNKYSIGKLTKEDKSGVRFKNRNSLYAGGEYKLLRTSEISKESLYFDPKESMLGIDHDELDDVRKHLVSGGVIVSGFNKKVKASILSKDETYALGQDVYWIKLDESIVIEEYLVQELYKPYITKQVEYYSKGIAIVRLSKKDFLNIQIQIPSLEVQRDILLKEYRKTDVKSQDYGISNKELDFIKTLKHSLKQPASSIGNDLYSLRTFIDNKIENGESLDSQETIVPLFDDDIPEQVEIHRLSNTLDRMGRAITDIDYILQQAMLIITAGSDPIKENVELKPFLNNFKTENPEITVKVTGKSSEILVDRKQLRILINNFIGNAKRHGFKKPIEKPIIWIEIKSKDALSIQISIRNNGKSLPPEFTIEDFLAKGESTKEDVGSGFGGFLIGQILNNHKGKVELIKSPQFGILPHNVEFLITLPK
jgi:signal transduction histidine kinase